MTPRSSMRLGGRARAVLFVCAASSVVACDSPPDPGFVRSCRGERYLECDPYEYTVALEASLTPAAIRPNDPAATAEVRVVLNRCAMRPSSSVEVQLLALIPRSDAGDDVRVVDLGIALRDDGTNGDLVADDGVIEGRITNPFGREIPGDRTILVSFVPVLERCAGDALDLEYATGATFETTP